MNTLHGSHLDGRWAGLSRIIQGVAPDLLLLQECSGWLDGDQRHIAQAERELGLRLKVGRSRTKIYTAVGWRQDKARWIAYESNRYTLANGYTGMWFEMEGLPAPLTVVSTQLSCYSAVQATIEAQTVLARTHKPQGLGLLGGDFNHVPMGDDEIDWSQVRPYNRTSRCLLPDPDAPDAPPKGNDVVGRVLKAADMTDVGAYVADQRGDPKLRAHTGVNGKVRVDQIHVTGALRPAIEDYWLVDTEGYSDHHAVAARLDLSKLDETKLHTFT
ncbi:endonuclease/exonuclease/phosphatase family protein [Sinosporangium album]|uniref:endonuclease/exonuclease/phosphatase family protein n=1 Tax=Sinosporangium album TaxID=504805 RepID=UPI00115F7F0F|nr:endonuclease/exonuclease/phosphatase family protein [Sinosporangium album]